MAPRLIDSGQASSQRSTEQAQARNGSRLTGQRSAFHRSRSGTGTLTSSAQAMAMARSSAVVLGGRVGMVLFIEYHHIQLDGGAARGLGGVQFDVRRRAGQDDLAHALDVDGGAAGGSVDAVPQRAARLRDAHGVGARG